MQYIYLRTCAINFRCVQFYPYLKKLSKFYFQDQEKFVSFLSISIYFPRQSSFSSKY